MREIRFRAWDGKEMRDSYLIARPQFADALKILQSEEWAKKQYGLNEWKVMQFTGLLDKNGKEIYEGDIVGSVYEFESDQIAQVVYDAPAFCLKDKKSGELFTMLSPGHLQVIGNIHENPDLLK